MLTASLALAVALLFLSRNVRGPIWAASIAWMICIAPIVLGIIDYRYLDYSDPRLGSILCGAMLAFAGGAAVEHAFRGPVIRRTVPEETAYQDFLSMMPIARVCWLIGIIGGGFLVIDFVMNGGSSLMNLADLRDSFVGKESASPLSRAASVMTWACLFSYLFALIFRRELGIKQTIFFALPVVGFLMNAVLSAGRQAALQMILVTVIGHILWKIRTPKPSVSDAQPKSGSGFVIAISGLMVAYMGYVAIARNDSRISSVKSEVLARLFDFDLSPTFEYIIGWFGSGVRETVIEALVYFSSSIALFDRFLKTDLFGISYGAMNFPFLYRQIEPLTNIDVAVMYQLRVTALDAQQVIGVGWTTAIANLIMDFGFVGAAVFLMLQGFLSAIAWRAAARGGSFLDCVLATLGLIGALYLPLIPAFSDNNLFFLLWFCLAIKWFDVRRGKALHVQAAAS
ncbi:O-antigen polymerase [Sphingomonas sp. PB1R3]|uniref:O-antigen polymerase n=1 Tax=Sphingomonas flavida TaxID=3096154 RepID=UPI002FCC150F